MDALKTKTKTPAAKLARLSNGCFTVDRSGRVIISTLPATFPAEAVQKIARSVLEGFRTAQEAQMVFTEICVSYPALKLTARELKGGGIVFVTPQSPDNV